jgi:hypothetical protein
VTRISELPVSPSALAEIVATPSEFAWMRPRGETLITSEFELFQEKASGLVTEEYATTGKLDLSALANT